MAEASASSPVGAEVLPTGVVGHEHDDVGLLPSAVCAAAGLFSDAEVCDVGISDAGARPDAARTVPAINARRRLMIASEHPLF
jgi:hypothetical protein